MGIAISVYGEISKDDPLYQKHAKVVLACLEAGVKKLPEETAKFFHSEYVEPSVLEEFLRKDIKVNLEEKDYCEIRRVKVSDLPKEVEYVCFYISH